MEQAVSLNDRQFKLDVEACEIDLVEFNHRAHIRLAYIYLAENSAAKAYELVKEALHQLLIHNNIEPSAKYHETQTKAWLLAVEQFKQKSNQCHSADKFIEVNPALLDTSLLLTHFSSQKLFSDEARNIFIQPDLNSIS